MKLKKELMEWGKSLFIALGIVVIVRVFFFDPYMVKGESMEPTLYEKEKVIVNKLNFNDDYNRGEIVVIKGKEENYVKRIIGLPGDTIIMKNDKLYINGVLYKEPYLADKLVEAKKKGSYLTGNFGPIKVANNNYFVMGDNRLYSKDSRNGLGTFTKEQIVGKSKFVYFPLIEMRTVK